MCEGTKKIDACDIWYVSYIRTRRKRHIHEENPGMYPGCLGLYYSYLFCSFPKVYAFFYHALGPVLTSFFFW